MKVESKRGWDYDREAGQKRIRLRNLGKFIILKEEGRIGAFHVLLGISQKNEGGILP
jgi:hypothetical protein